MNEISYCPENGKIYIPEYAEKIWEIDGVDGELKLIIKDLLDRRPPQRRHHLQGRLPLLRAGAAVATPASPIRTTTAGPTSRTIRSGLTHPDGHPARRRTIRRAATSCTPASTCKSSDGRLTGALLPVGVPAKPGMKIKAQGALRRLGHAGQDRRSRAPTASTPHDKMEVYAMGFRNQSGVAFGPAGQQVRERARGLRQRRQRPRQPPDRQRRREDLAGDRDGAGRRLSRTRKASCSSTGKRYGWTEYRGNPVDRPLPEPLHRRGAVRADDVALPLPVPCRGRARRAAHHRQSQPGRLHQPDPGVGHQQPDRRHRLERLAASAPTTTCSARSTASSTPARRAWCRPGRRSCRSSSWSPRASSGRTSRATSRWARTRTRSRRTGAASSGRTTSCSRNDGKTMYIVDYGEVFTDFEMPSPFYTVPKSGVIWTVTKQVG